MLSTRNFVSIFLGKFILFFLRISSKNIYEKHLVFHSFEKNLSDVSLLLGDTTAYAKQLYAPPTPKYFY